MAHVCQPELVAEQITKLEAAAAECGRLRAKVAELEERLDREHGEAVFAANR